MQIATMQIGTIQILCIGIILICVISSIRRALYSEDLEEVIEPILGGCSTIISFFVMIGFYTKFSEFVANIIKKFFPNSTSNGVVYLGALLILFIILKLVIEGILRLINSLSFSSSLTKTSNKGILILLSTVLGMIRGIVLIVLICLPLILYNNVVEGERRINILNDLKIYNKLDNLVDGVKIKNISDGLLENVTVNRVSYYNGVTLDEGIKSNEVIDKKAKEITRNASSDREKARAIYAWIGSNIKYDDNKAEKVLSGDTSVSSGAIPTFNSRSGICFDYACLYTAMCKSVGLKSRIIVGEAYNGSSFISHAWNEVYLADEGKWINVDSTFYVAGNYFDNTNFNEEHINSSIAGEF